MMVEDLESRGLTDADAHRVEMAISSLGPHIQKWPTSKMVIEALPPHQFRPFREMLLPPSPMDAYVDNYIAKNPMATKREACMKYLREKQSLKRLPKSLQDEESEAEANAERKAIQDEVTGGI